MRRAKTTSEGATGLAWRKGLTWRVAMQCYEREKKARGEWSAQRASKIRSALELVGGETMLVRDLSHEMIEAAIESRIGEVKAQTIHGYLNVAKAALGCLKRARLLSAGELADLRDCFPPGVKDVVRTEHLEADEAAKLLRWVKANRPDAYGLLAALVGLGPRLNEAMRLRRRDFRVVAWFDGTAKKEHMQASITAPDHGRRSKTIERGVPVPDYLRDWIEREATPLPDGTLFHRDGVAFDSDAAAGRHAREAMRDGLRAIGSAWRLDGAKGFHVHDLRHTYAYLQAQAGTPLADLQTLMGHSDISMTMRYRGFVMANAVRGTREAFKDFGKTPLTVVAGE